MKPDTLDKFIVCAALVGIAFIVISTVLVLFKPDEFRHHDVIGCGTIFFILSWLIGSPIYFLFIRETKWYKK